MINNKKAFTLIEMLIVMMIFAIIVMGTFVPYSHYQNKLNLKLWAKEVSKSLYDARNMALNWLSSTWNKSIWLYFDSTSWNNNKLTYFSYPYNLTWSSIDVVENSYIKKIREITLPKKVYIKDISGKDNWLFYFSSISWTWNYYYFDSSGVKKTFTWELVVNIAYDNSGSDIFNMHIKYFTWTYITDY